MFLLLSQIDINGGQMVYYELNESSCVVFIFLFLCYLFRVPYKHSWSSSNDSWTERRQVFSVDQGLTLEVHLLLPLCVCVCCLLISNRSVLISSFFLPVWQREEPYHTHTHPCCTCLSYTCLGHRQTGVSNFCICLLSFYKLVFIITQW